MGPTKKVTWVVFSLAVFSYSSSAQADDLTRFVPSGWSVIGEVTKGKNAVLMIEEADPSKFKKNDGLGAEVLNTNPRKLLFLRETNGNFEVIGSADHFLPSENDADAPCEADPLGEGGMSLSNGVFTLSFSYWASCGGYGSAKSSYKFRLEENRYRLIGVDGLVFSRASGEGDETSINYLTGRKSIAADVQVIQVDDYDKPVERRKVWSRVGNEKYYLDSMSWDQCDGRRSEPSWCLND